MPGRQRITLERAIPTRYPIPDTRYLIPDTRYQIPNRDSLMKNSMADALRDRLAGGVDLALSLGATAAKLRFSHSEGISCKFESGRLKNTDARETFGYSVSVLLDGKLGVTSGNDLEGLEEMVRRAATLAGAGSAAHFDAYPAPGDFTPVKKHSERTLGLTRERMIADSQLMVDRLKDYDAEMDINAGAGRGESESLLVTSGGVCHSSRSTNWSIGAHVQRTEGTDMLFAGHGRGFADLNEFYDPDYVADKVLWQLRLGEAITEPPTGPIKVYVPPETLPMFFWPINMGLNGRSVAKGESPLKERLGDQVLDPCLTIVDDPHREWKGRELDGDGIPTRKNVLFDGGTLKMFLYDLDSAGLAGTEPTGNDGCSPHNSIVTPGEVSSEELLASVDDGIYILGLLGFGQSNIVNGDFSANVGLGYRIRDGKIVGRVKNTMVAGNIYECFKQNVRLSSDVDPVSLMPHAVVEGVTASTKGGG